MGGNRSWVCQFFVNAGEKLDWGYGLGCHLHRLELNELQVVLSSEVKLHIIVREKLSLWVIIEQT